MPLFILLLSSLFLNACHVLSADEVKGIVDSHFIQAKVTTNSTTGQPNIEVFFRPNIFSIPSSAKNDAYDVSLTILESNMGMQDFDEHTSIFISFINEGTPTNPIFRYQGMTIKNCLGLCDNMITNLFNETGRDLTDPTDPQAILSPNIQDGFYHLQILLDPYHKGELWRAIHGYVGTSQNGNVYQLLPPYYRVDFSIPKT